MIVRSLLAALVLAVATPALAAPAETELTVQGPGGPLKGSMLTPEGAGRPPVVLIIPGSGPTSRDGDNPMGLNGKPLKQLAEDLAGLGVASVRIDKRGQFGSAGATFGEAGPTAEAYAADVQAWVADIRKRTGAPCVWLLGHSEGGLIALLAAQKPDGVCGLVLAATGGRKLGDIMREQIKGNPANPAFIVEQAEKGFAELEAGRRVDPAQFHPGLQPLFNPAAQGLLISEMALDPADLLRRYQGPVLVVQGGSDIQIRMSDAERLAGARPNVKLVAVPGMNHAFRASAADMAATLASYGDAGARNMPEVAPAIADFVKSAR